MIEKELLEGLDPLPAANTAEGQMRPEGAIFRVETERNQGEVHLLLDADQRLGITPKSNPHHAGLLDIGKGAAGGGLEPKRFGPGGNSGKYRLHFLNQIGRDVSEEFEREVNPVGFDPADLGVAFLQVPGQGFQLTPDDIRKFDGDETADGVAFHKSPKAVKKNQL